MAFFEKDNIIFGVEMQTKGEMRQILKHPLLPIFIKVGYMFFLLLSFLLGIVAGKTGMIEEKVTYIPSMPSFSGPRDIIFIILLLAWIVVEISHVKGRSASFYVSRTGLLFLVYSLAGYLTSPSLVVFRHGAAVTIGSSILMWLFTRNFRPSYSLSRSRSSRLRRRRLKELSSYAQKRSESENNSRKYQW